MERGNVNDSANVVPLKPVAKSTIRVRRHRAKLKAAKVAAEQATETLPETHETRQETHPETALVPLFAALALAGCSGYFSIFGLTSIFQGAVVPVIAMGCALEIGQLTAVATLGRGYIRQSLRLALVCLVGMLMALNVVGI